MSEVLVWTGTHPEEEEPLEVGESLRSDPIEHVTTLIANVEAYKLGKRFIDLNLVAAFPGDPESPLYESRRAVEIVRTSRDYDYVVDLHSADGSGGTTASIDREKGVSPKVLHFLGEIGVKNLVLSEGMGMKPHVTNSFTLEMVPETEIERLRAGFDLLANGPLPLDSYGATDFKWFEFIGGLHKDHLDPSTLGEERLGKLRPFEEFPELTAAMGRRACVMAWSHKLNIQGYWGEMVVPCDAPDTSQWPTDKAA
jgi:hypothetical protein